jgi:hypothetical protein
LRKPITRRNRDVLSVCQNLDSKKQDFNNATNGSSDIRAPVAKNPPGEDRRAFPWSGSEAADAGQVAQLASFQAHVGQLGVGKRFGAGLAVGLQFPAPAQAFKQGRREECHCREASRANRGMSAREMPRSAMQQRDIRCNAEARRE